MRIHVLKTNTHAVTWLGVDHDTRTFKVAAFRVDLEDGLAALGQRLREFDIAAVESQFGNAGGEACLRALFEDFRGRYEGKSGSSPALVLQKSTSERNCEILSAGGAIVWPKGCKNRRKQRRKWGLRRKGLTPE